jgi:phosphohistidine phosphatase
MSDPVNLFLMRHAHALDESEDPARPLSARGRVQVAAVAQFLRARGSIAVERVWHSPLLRAAETAELFCERLGLAANRREIDGLLPFDDVRGVARRFSGFGYPLLVVGHEPHLGRLVSMLVCGNVDQEIVDFKKGALLCLEREATKSQAVLWRIRWFLTPALVANDGAGGEPAE